MDSSPSNLLQHFRRLLERRRAGDCTDAQLLGRFAATHDETAFAALLQRHGPLVLGVCRRVLGDAHDAEDAFQASFLVLARKASSIRNQESVGSWLAGVAYKIAARARASATRRRHHEHRAGEQASMSMPPDRADQELRPILDEELQHLPRKYRTPLVLCYLEGKTNEEAAAQLQCPPGTMKSRLARAREMLRQRLARRGAVPSTAVLSALVTEVASPAAPPPALAEITLRCALGFVSGPATFEAIPGPVLALAKWMLTSMSLKQLRGACAILLGLTVLGGGTGWIIHSSDSKAVEPQLAAAATPPEQLRDHLGDPLPPGAVARIGTLRLQHLYPFAGVAFSPDGQTLAAPGYGSTVYLWDTASGREVRRLEGHRDSVESVAYSSDGRLLATVGAEGTVLLWDAATGKELRRCLGHTKRVRFVAFAPNDRLLASGGDDMIRLWDVATGQEVRQLPAYVGTSRHRSGCLVFSPDCKMLVGGGDDSRTVTLWDVASMAILYEHMGQRAKAESLYQRR